MSRVLIVDDDEAILKALRRLLTLTPLTIAGERRKLGVDCCSSPQKALEIAGYTPYDLFIADYRMPVMNGVKLLKRLREIQPDAARLILSAYADLNGLIDAINDAGICRFIAKPWNDYELVSTLGQVLEMRELALDNQRLADEMRALKGNLSAEEIERRRLEALEPGITRVTWGPDGSVLLDGLPEDSLPDE